MADNVVPIRNTQKRQQSDKAMNRALAAYQMGIEKCREHDLKFEVAQLEAIHRMLEGLAKYGDEESTLPPEDYRIEQCWVLAACGPGEVSKFFQLLAPRKNETTGDDGMMPGVHRALDYCDDEWVLDGLRRRRRELRQAYESRLTYGDPNPKKNWWEIAFFVLLGWMVAGLFWSADRAEESGKDWK